MEKNRKYKRIDTILDIEIITKTKTIETSTIDISEKGMLSIHEEEITDEFFKIIIEQDIIIEKAKVTYDNGNYFGIEFIEISEENIEKIKRLTM